MYPILKPEHPAEGSVSMKHLIRILLLMVIACAALYSVTYAVRIYRTKYAPRYLNGNAG